MSEDIQFLRDLQEELKTQENDGQAAPRFWAIMDYKYIPTDSDYADRTSILDTDDPSGVISIDEYMKSIMSGDYSDEFTDEQKDDLQDVVDGFGLYDLEEWIGENDDSKMVVYEKEESFIAWNTLFFTKQEAEDHLKANAHHYTSKAHTFAMTAWRAPKMERLMEILESFDWDSI